MAECRRGRGIGEIVGRNIDRLHRCDRTLLCGCYPLLQFTHLCSQGGLVPDGRGHPAEQRRHLGARLHEPEDIVDEEQHILSLIIAEIFGDGKRRQSDPLPGSGRLVHLTEDERGLVQHARFLHLKPKVIAFTRSLSHPGEHRVPAVMNRDVMD